MRARRTSALAVGLVLSVASVGCGAIAERATEEVLERAIESGGDGKVELDGDGGQMTIETEDGTMTFGSTAVPTFITDNFDVPSGNVTYASEMGGPEGTTASVGIEVDGKGADVAQALESSLKSGGWTIDSTISSPDSWIWSATKGDLTAVVAVTAAEGSPTGVQVTINQPAG